MSQMRIENGISNYKDILYLICFEETLLRIHIYNFTKKLYSAGIITYYEMVGVHLHVKPQTVRLVNVSLSVHHLQHSRWHYPRYISVTQLGLSTDLSPRLGHCRFLPTPTEPMYKYDSSAGCMTLHWHRSISLVSLFPWFLWTWEWGRINPRPFPAERVSICCCLPGNLTAAVTACSILCDAATSWSIFRVVTLSKRRRYNLNLLKTIFLIIAYKIQ